MHNWATLSEKTTGLSREQMKKLADAALSSSPPALTAASARPQGVGPAMVATAEPSDF